jgi:hypothetical protein
MTPVSRWEKANERFLAAALEWLRLRLAGLAEGDVSRRDVAIAAKAFETARDADPLPALVVLGRRLGLSSFEVNSLLLCVAMELDTRIPGLCARAQGDTTRAYPTFALALALFDDAAWDGLSPERPLRLWKLIEVHQPGAQPLTASALRADERIVDFVKGLHHLDDRLSPFLAPFDLPASGPLAATSQRAVATAAAEAIRAGSGGSRPGLVQLVGTDARCLQVVAILAANELGLQLIRVPAAGLPTLSGELELLARLCARESLLAPIALFVDVDEHHEAEPQLSSTQRLLAPGHGVAFLAVREAVPGLGGTIVDVHKPTAAEQRTAWTAALGPKAGDAPSRLAGQFSLDLATISEIGAQARHVPEFVTDRAWRSCLLRTRPRLERLAARVEPTAKWDDLILPADQLDQLKQLSAQVCHRLRVYDDWGFRNKTSRGLGISALFVGESGTGKTFAAEALAGRANEKRDDPNVVGLGLDLYRIDLSAVVSKYIGETEKNLRRLFDAAEEGGAILFFDEADALFGKRSEVKDSHDRYANIEINYLLQRMEAYRGLAILASNMKSALDLAFLRRLRFIVHFPFPGPLERRRIWERSFPEATPLERTDPERSVDFDRLAGIDLTGGAIHNAALNAAFLAASDGGVVTMPLVLTAVRGELRKLGRSVGDAIPRSVAHAVMPAGART